MEFLQQAFDVFLHIDAHLSAVIAQYGPLTYAILFAVIFCETGLVVTPFLPGDSLLFAAGAFAAKDVLDPLLLFGLLLAAATLGDSVNYAVGAQLGARAFREGSRVFKEEYLAKTQRFYARYGAKTIVIARFVPIVRTFAPFIAGVGGMHYGTFITYNVLGGLLWVSLFVFGGYLFGNIPFVEKNFEFVILGIIALSLLPPFIDWIRARRAKSKPLTGA